MVNFEVDDGDWLGRPNLGMTTDLTQEMIHTHPSTRLKPVSFTFVLNISLTLRHRRRASLVIRPWLMLSELAILLHIHTATRIYRLYSFSSHRFIDIFFETTLPLT
jgi:hypothetical protein